MPNELVDFLNTEKLNLKGAFAIHGDPDYYFGIEQILRSVPKLEVLSTEETQQHIAESVIGKLAVWSSVLQEQAPVNVILLKAVTGDKLNILGAEFEFVGDDKRPGKHLHNCIGLPGLSDLYNSSGHIHPVYFLPLSEFHIMILFRYCSLGYMRCYLITFLRIPAFFPRILYRLSCRTINIIHDIFADIRIFLIYL